MRIDRTSLNVSVAIRPLQWMILIEHSLYFISGISSILFALYSVSIRFITLSDIKLWTTGKRMDFISVACHPNIRNSIGIFIFKGVPFVNNQSARSLSTQVSPANSVNCTEPDNTRCSDNLFGNGWRTSSIWPPKNCQSVRGPNFSENTNRYC